MGEPLRLIGGVSVDCADGACGVMGQTLIEPITKSVTHIAIEPTGLGNVGRLAPLTRLRSTGNGLQLDCTLAEFETLEPDEVVQRVLIPGVRPGVVSAPRVFLDRIPDGLVAVNGTTDLHAIDGSIGRLQGFVVDSADGRVLEVVLEIGHFSKKRDVAVPGAFVSSISADVILFGLSKSQIEGR